MTPALIISYQREPPSSHFMPWGGEEGEREELSTKKMFREWTHEWTMNINLIINRGNDGTVYLFIYLLIQPLSLYGIIR